MNSPFLLTFLTWLLESFKLDMWLALDGAELDYEPLRIQSGARRSHPRRLWGGLSIGCPRLGSSQAHLDYLTCPRWSQQWHHPCRICGVPGYWVAMQPPCRGAEREQREMLPYPLALEAQQGLRAWQLGWVTEGRELH